MGSIQRGKPKTKDQLMEELSQLRKQVARLESLKFRYRQLEEEFRKKEEGYRLLVENIEDVVWTTDMNLQFTYISPSVVKLRGYTAKEALAQTVEQMLTPESFKIAMQAFKEQLAIEEMEEKDLNRAVTLELEQTCKDGSTVWTEVKMTFLRDEQGKAVGILGVSRNISQRKSLEKRLKEQEEKRLHDLEELLKERSGELMRLNEEFRWDIAKRRKVEEKLSQSLKRVREAMEVVTQAITFTVESRDPYTVGHQQRVASLASAIAKEMDLSEFQIDEINTAATIHDLGKMYVPIEILNKPAKLTEIEFGIVKNHPQIGVDILKKIGLPESSLQIILQHHERLNGSGYPQALAGEDVCLGARIVAVADVVEAMTFQRPYRQALGLDAALDNISKNIDTLYDFQVVNACLVLFTERGFEFEEKPVEVV